MDGERTGFSANDNAGGAWRRLHESLREANGLRDEVDVSAEEAQGAASVAPGGVEPAEPRQLIPDLDNDEATIWDQIDSEDEQPHGAGSVIEWLIWTLATAVPVFSAAAWLTMAFRKRRWGLLYETAAVALWPILSIAILVCLALFLTFSSLLLLYRHDYDSGYRDHTDELMVYEEAYHWVGDVEQLGDVGRSHFEFLQINGGAPLLKAFYEYGMGLLVLLGPLMWIASIFHAQRSWFRRFAPRKSGDEPPSKLFISAFALWLLLGWTGAHRFYLGRWITGFLYLLSFGGLGIGWGMDLFGLRDAVDDANAIPRAAPQLAPWAAETQFGVGDFIARFIFFLVAPGLFAWVCVLSGHFELLLVLLFTLIVCGLFGDVQRSLESFAWLRSLPFTRPATLVAQQLYDFYSVHRPRSFWFYLFAPITAPLAWFRSAKFREESRLSLQFLGTIVGAVMINQFRQILTTYQYHSIFNIAMFITLHLVVATAIAAVMLTPILATTYSYNLSGRVRRLRVLSISALCVSCICGMGAIGLSVINKQPSPLSYMLIGHRLRDETFQQQFTQSTKLFLEHYVERTPKPISPLYPLASHPGLTQRFQEEVLAALVPADEAKVFRVFTMDVDGDQPDGAWLGVGMVYSEDSSGGWRSLFMMSPKHEFYTAWDEQMPPRVREDFATAKDLWNGQYEHRLARRDPEKDLQLYDQVESYLRNYGRRIAEQPSSWRVRATPPQSGESLPLDQALRQASRQQPVFDPNATRELRRQLSQQWGDEALRFRVFLLPPTAGGRRSSNSMLAVRQRDGWWLGVMDGDQPLAVLTPWGDYFREWDRDVYAPFRNVVGQMDLLASALRSPDTLELWEDVRRSRARIFLDQFIHDSREAKDINDQLRPYLIRHTSRLGWAVEEWNAEGEGCGRWLAITVGGTPQYVLSPHRDFFYREQGALENVAGIVLPAKGQWPWAPDSTSPNSAPTSPYIAPRDRMAPRVARPLPSRRPQLRR